jgi:ArsR family transcriptional regulator
MKDPRSAHSPSKLAGSLNRSDANRLAELIKAAADPTRLQLLSFISSVEEACVCDLQEEVGLSQPTISYHLKRLTKAGLLVREQRATWAWYRVNRDRVAELAALFGQPVHA